MIDLDVSNYFVLMQSNKSKQKTVCVTLDH